MNPYYICTHIDEFNYIYSANLDAYNLQKKLSGDCEIHTAVFSEFDVMFPDMDKIYTKPVEAKDSLGAIESIAANRDLVKTLHQEGSKQASANEDMEFVTDNEIANDIRKKKHVYEYTFSNSAKRILEGDMKFINPKKQDYENVSKFVASINVNNKKILAINGRNLNKIPERNQLFESVIDDLISRDFFIINLTINPPGLNYPADSYFELSEPNLSYSNMVSFFLIADCVLSVCDSGGVNVHILTEANFIFLGPGGWLDNPAFGYNGKSLLDTRKDNTGFFTEHQVTYNVETIIESVNKIEPKIPHNSFFDETKIVSL